MIKRKLYLDYCYFMVYSVAIRFEAEIVTSHCGIPTFSV